MLTKKLIVFLNWGGTLLFTDVINFSNANVDSIIGATIPSVSNNIQLLISLIASQPPIFTLKTILDKFKAFLSLKKRLSLLPITDAVLQLSIKGEDPELNTKIIEALLSTYNDDGINDNKMLDQMLNLGVNGIFTDNHKFYSNN